MTVALFYVVLTLLSWACLWPMLRMPEYLPEVRIPTDVFVPDTTFDSRGFV